MASFLRASESSRSSLLALVDQRGEARRACLERRLELRRRGLGSLRMLLADLRAAAPVSASMRRTPAATALSPTTVMRPMSPVRAHMRAAAQFDRPAHAHCRRHRRPSRRRAPRRRISRRTAPARRTRWPRRRAISRVVTGAFCSTMSLAMSSTRSSLLGADRLGVREVEAQPVGRDQRALLRDVIAEHLAQRLVQEMGRRMVGADRRRGARDRRRAASAIADLERALLDHAAWTKRSPGFFCVSVTRTRTPSPRHRPVSPTWPPDSP